MKANCRLSAGTRLINIECVDFVCLCRVLTANDQKQIWINRKSTGPGGGGALSNYTSMWSEKKTPKEKQIAQKICKILWIRDRFTYLASD